MVHKFFVAFIPIFVAIDAIGLVAVFMGLAGDTPREQRQRLLRGVRQRRVGARDVEVACSPPLISRI